MAIDHSGNTDFGGGHYGLNLIWSASQSISGNYSDISATLQISAYGGYSIVANATKYGHITIDGEQFDFSAVVGTLKASNSPKTLATAWKRVYHNTDGSKYLDASASFSLNATLSGSWVGTITTAADYSLDAIPRASSISTSNFTVGDNVTVNVNRASSSFTHSIQLDVNGTAIKTASGVGASYTWTFTEADVKKIYAAMGGATSGSVVLWCNTYSGSTLVGDAKGTATCYQVGNSTLQTAPTFVIGDSRAYTINRLRTAVTHTLQIYAGSTLVKTITGVGTSYTMTLTEAEIAKIYALGTSVSTKVVCTAYHYGRNIGTSQQTGIASAPPVSSITSSPNHTIGSGYTTSISRSRNAVTHTLRLYVAGKQIKEIGGVGTSYNWVPTQTEIAAEYAATPNGNTAAAQATIWCYHYGKLIGTATAGGTATVDPVEAAPVFSGFSFVDKRPETTALTGNNQVLVAGESALEVTIPAAQAASSTTSATIKQYILYCGGATTSAAYSASDMTIQLAGASSGSIRVAAVDSRGNQTVVERLASLVPYTPPRITQMQLRRDNNVDNKTKLTVKGVWWPGNFGAADNALSSAYQYKVTSAEQYTDGGTVSITITGEEWSFDGYLPGDLGIEGFDFQKSFSVVLNVTDAFTTAAANGIVDRGIPTMHMDKGGVGIGKIRENGALDVEGDVYSADKRLVRVNEAMLYRRQRGDSDTLDDAASEYGYNYSTSGSGLYGPYISAGALNGTATLQLASNTQSGHILKFRTKDVTTSKWNPWRTVYNDASKPYAINSLGNLNIETGRTSARGNIYTYNTIATSAGAPVTYSSVLGFGRNTAGSIEICGDWLGGKGLWIRSLRDTTDSWTGWTRVFTEAYKPTPAQIGALSTDRDVTIAWGNGGYYVTFAGRFQICTKQISGTAAITNPWGNSYESTSSFDFGLWPRKFTATPATFVALAPSPNGGSYSVEPLIGTNATNIGHTYLYRSANISNNVPFALFALGIGEWK
ncbi:MULTISPECIES: DUF859 family phage minor structural protein [Eubacteriales]|uniref:Uncharacterized protein n=1 Tax=Bittarella massiliensis (ex Durand et al. 2017) TaxID=1720313 RepID=A0ABW9WTU1_9FIRM|nr:MULTISPECIES: DUF859 family phage minor structural protein [Eubacteriales]MZL69152.1 hypothetical protein [Bittarella massiliensis (ex Durand et al. 2017)]MZL79842.1 hypothetical protein [Bittarella massiliensis (ex Durand et al. 2017)]